MSYRENSGGGVRGGVARGGLCLSLALLLGGCKGAPERVDSGNDPDKSVLDYTRSETENFCNAFSEYGESLIDEEIYCGGMRLVAAYGSWRQDGTLNNAQTSCVQAAARCKEDFRESSTELNCSTMRFNVECDVTTRQFEDCFTLLLDTIMDEYRSFPACNELTADFLADYFTGFSSPGASALESQECAPLRPGACG